MCIREYVRMGTRVIAIEQSGTCVNGEVNTATTLPGENIRLTFSGTAGQQVNVQVTNSTFPGSCYSVVLSILKPDGTQLANTGLCGGATGGLSLVSLPVTGTYTVVVDPQNGVTGSAVVTLSIN